MICGPQSGELPAGGQGYISDVQATMPRLPLQADPKRSTDRMCINPSGLVVNSRFRQAGQPGVTTPFPASCHFPINELAGLGYCISEFALLFGINYRDTG